jgi:hypothetical protein
MTTTAVRPDIVAFAAAVRSQLDDLPADDVDDLLDGLEADLSDQADEAGAAFELPDAAAYAAELRTAAGLPVRARGGKVRRTLDTLDRAAADRWRSFVAAVRTQPFTGWVIDTLIALRLVWWLVRAGVLYILLVPLLPIAHPRGTAPLDLLVSPTVNLVYAVILTALVVLSVQWGRGRWAPVAWLRVLRTVVSVIAVIAAPFLFMVLVNEGRAAMNNVQSVGYQSYEPGLAVDGQRVRNVFAYDAQGNPIEQVQLFDQDGQPLTTVGPNGSFDDWDYYFYGGGGPVPVARQVAGRQPVWNSFPLREVTWTEGSEIDPDDAVVPSFPFREVPPLPAPLSADDTTTTAQEMTEVSPTPSPAP